MTVCHGVFCFILIRPAAKGRTIRFCSVNFDETKGVSFPMKQHKQSAGGFPLRRQLAALYGYELASCIDITTAVWVALLAARGYSLWQVGLAEGVHHMVSLAAEIPSGMAADLLGRRRTLAVSGLMAALSGLLMAFEQGYGFVLASMALSALSYNLISGTLEALSYDSLCAAGCPALYPAVQTRCALLQSAGALLGNLGSLLTAVLPFRAYYLVDVALSGLRSLAAAFLREPVVTQAQAAREAAGARTLLATLPRRLRAHTAATVRFLRGSPAVARLIFANAIISLPCYLTLMFLQQRLSAAGLPTALLGLIVCLFELGRPVGSWLSLRLRPRRLAGLYAACAAAGGVCTVAAGLAPLPLAVLAGAGFAGCEMLWTLCSERRLNDQFPSDQRATLVSVDSMVYSLLMIPASPLTGLAGDLTGAPGAGLALLGLGLVGAGAAAKAYAEKNKKNKE